MLLLIVELISSNYSNVMSDARLTAVSPAQLVSDTGKVINSMLYKHTLFAIISGQTSAHNSQSKLNLIPIQIKLISIS